MPRPQITVEVSAALPRRGTDTPTGRAFMVYIGATGPTTPLVCLSPSTATAASVPDPVVQWIGDALATGAPDVVVVRAVPSDPEAVVQADWAAALALFTETYGPGQVLIPGVSTSPAHSALLAHADLTGRVALLDSANDAAASAISTAASALTSADGASHATMLAPWVEVSSGGVSRDVPPSVLVAGLVGRGDAAVGHANHAPAGTQGRSAGVIQLGKDVTATFTATELDTLHEAGVSVIRQLDGTPTLYGWVSLSDDVRFRQLNVARSAMMLGDAVSGLARDFIFRPIDGQGHLYSELEGVLRGYLQQLWSDGALYGATPDAAFDVAVASVNTPETAAAGVLNAVVEVALTPHTERITISVATRLPEGAAA